jgi:hypothetical protein
MTVVAAKIRGLGVDFAWDDSVFEGSSVYRLGRPKVWGVGGLTIGAAGDLDAIDALRFSWTPEASGAYPRDRRTWMFLQEWAEVLADFKGEEAWPIEALLFDGRTLWKIGDDLTHVQVHYAAVGEGAPWAEGALYAGATTRQAVLAADRHCAYVRLLTEPEELWTPRTD